MKSQSRATIINQYMQGYVVCHESKMHPKAHGVSSFFPSMAITWDFRMRQPRPQWYFITPWLYHPISITSYDTRTLHWYTSQYPPMKMARDRDIPQFHPFFAIPSGNLT